VHTELILVALALGSLTVTAVCRRHGLGAWAPLALVVVGPVASFLPGVGALVFDPNVVLLVVLTPLLYSAALQSSYLGVRENLHPIVLLAVGRQMGLPKRVMTILGGESLLNDATALTLSRVFVAAAAGVGMTVFEALWVLTWSTVGGLTIGLAIGWLVHRIRRATAGQLAGRRSGRATRCWSIRRERSGRPAGTNRWAQIAPAVPVPAGASAATVRDPAKVRRHR
jgi:CPA1 family monovalent cation:H+ antiporter